MATSKNFNMGSWVRQSSPPYYNGNSPRALLGAAVSALWTATVDFDHANAGMLQFRTSRVQLSATGTATVIVERVGGYNGAVSCTVKTNSTTGAMAMTAGTHFTNVTEVVTFADQEAGAKSVDINVGTSPGAGLHMLVVTMDTPTGGVTLRNPEMQIYFDDGGVNPSATVLTTGSNIQTALDAASAGDLIYFRAGTYTSNNRPSGMTYGGYHINNSGTQFARIVLTPYPAEAAIIDPNYQQTHDGQGDGATVGFIANAGYFTIKGFEITKCLHSGVRNQTGNLSGIIVEDCHIHDCGNPPNGLADYIQEIHADNIGGIRLDGAFGCIERYNEIHDIYDVRTATGTSNPWNAYPASAHSGIHGYYMEQAWIHHNTIYKVGKAIFQKNPDDTDGIGHRIHNNNISQITGDGFEMGFIGAGQPGVNWPMIYNNLFDFSAAESANSSALKGIMPSNEQASDANDLWAFNNTQIGGADFYFGAAIKNKVFYNNVLDGASSTMIIEDTAASSNVAYCDYNCYTGGTFRVWTQRYSNLQQYATLSAWQGSSPSDAAVQRAPDGNTITTAPTYTNSGAGDYTTTTGVTVSTGRFSRDIGIGSEGVGHNG